MSTRVNEILSWYRSENAGVLTNLRRLMCTGKLANTGKLVILPVDQGFEHGPIRSFEPNPVGYDPSYHFDLAIESGCNAYAAPLGFLSAEAANYAGEIPLILKLNNSDLLYKNSNPIPAVTGSVDDALRLGCAGIGFTIYPGSMERKDMYQEFREISEEARAKGLAVVLWSYPRGEQLSKDGETAIDITCYAAQVAAQLGAHIIKVKPPTSHVELKDNQSALTKSGTKIETLADRVRLVLKSAFNGKRIVIFSGGEAKDDNSVLEEIRALNEGGAFGSIVGRNAFQRNRADAIKLLSQIQDIYRGK